MCRKNLFVLFFIFFISSVVLAASARNVKIEQTEVKNEVLYIAGENEPFTGIVQKFYEDGNLEIESEFKEGILDGVSKSYYKNTKLEMEGSYTEGRKNGVFKEYYENGKIKSEINYSYDLKEGLAKTYYSNGNVEAEGNFENGEEIGTTRVYYENGKLKEEIPYTNGVINGHHIQYSKNGKVLKKTFYDNGVEYKGIPTETIVLIIAVIIIVILIVIKIVRTLPSFKLLEDYQKEWILKKFIEYDNGDENLYSSYRLNGCGTGFYTVRTFTVYNEKIKVLTKMISVFFIPIPFALGYLVCYDNKKIICSISKEHFNILKKEIKEQL